MEEEKEAEFQELSGNNGDCSPVLVVSSLFEQSILLSGQVFNTTSYIRRKSVFETLIDGKPKVKEILREQSECINDANNQFLFVEYFKNEFSKSDNTKQKSKALFTRLKKQRANASYVTKPMTVNTKPTYYYNFPDLTYHQQQPFQGNSLQRRSRGRGQLF